MRALNRAGQRLEIAAELISFLWHQRLWWLIPMVVVVIAVGMLLVLAQGSALSPFIYALF